jgi:hypothetical protein
MREFRHVRDHTVTIDIPHDLAIRMKGIASDEHKTVQQWAVEPLNSLLQTNGAQRPGSAQAILSVLRVPPHRTAGRGVFRPCAVATVWNRIAYGKAETPFSPVELSPTELAKLTTFCQFIQSNGSGFGICKSCRTGGLGAVNK